MFFYLSVKRVSLQLEDTLELVSVALGHNQAVFLSLEEFGLIEYFVSTSGEVPFPFNIDIGTPFPIFTKPSRLLLVSVQIDDQGKPQSVDLIQGEGVQERLSLQILVTCSNLLPLKADLELHLYEVVLFLYGNNFVERN